MKPSEVLKIFKEKGALLEGHFKLSSGLHSAKYLQCALVLQHPHIAEKLGRELASKFKTKKIDAVVSPAIGGLIIGQEVTRALNARAIFCEREEGVMKLRRGFQIKKDERFLVIEDVITTGGTTKEVIELVKRSGGKIAGVGAIIDRSLGGNIRKKALLKLDIRTYPEKTCPLCKKSISLEKPGSKPRM